MMSVPILWTSAFAQQIYSTTDAPTDTPTPLCLGGGCFSQVLMASWTSSVSFDSVSISGEFGADDSSARLTAYLTTQVGPGTTAANQIASVTLTPPSLDSPGVLLFSGLNLGPGTYYLVLSGPAIETSFSYWYEYNLPTVSTASGVSAGSLGVANVVDSLSSPSNTYAPASVFDTVNAPVLSIRVGTAALQSQTITFGPLSNQTLGSSPVALSATASSGLAVTFASDSPTVCTVAGSTVTLVSTGTCSIMASQVGNGVYAAASPVTQSFTISLATPVQVSGVACSPTSLGQSAVSSCTVTLTQTAPAGGSAVTLSSNNALLTVQGSVTVTSGATTATFSATASATIPNNQSATVTATLGASSQTASISLVVPVQVSGVVCSPTSLGQSAVSSCTVTLTQAAPTGGSTVTLSSNNALLTVPSSVTVASGATTATFSATAAATIASNQSATVTATFGASSKVATISLTAAANSGGGGGGGGGLLPPAGSTLTAMPTSLTFKATAGATPPSQQIALSSSIPGTSYTVGIVGVAGGAGTWLSVSPASGDTDSQGTLTVSADPTGLGEGMYTVSINILSSQGGLASVIVTLNNEPQLTVSPASLSFTYHQGAAPPGPQGVSIFSNPAGVQVTAAANSGTWLGVTGGGTTPNSVSVSVNSGMAPGTYTGAVTISSPSADPVNVPVTYTVVNLPPKLSVSPLTQSFNLSQGGSPTPGQLTISNTVGGTLRFGAQASSDQGNWLTVMGSGSGSATPSTPASLGFTADPTGLTAGIYTGQITVTDVSSGTQITASVTLAVSPSSQSLTLSQSALAFSAIAGAQTPPSQSVTVSGQNLGSTGWTATAETVSNPAAPSVNWLSVSPASGSSLGISPMEVSVTPAGLPAGQYYGSINVTAPGANNSPQSVSVMLSVASATSTTEIQFSRGGVTLSGPAGSANPQQQQISLFNPSNNSVNYSSAVFTSNGTGWLSVSPATGTLSPGNSVVTIAANLSGLSAGIQTGTITVAFDNGTLGVIQVSATATSATAASSACPTGIPSYLVPVFRQPLSMSVLQVAVPQIVQLQIADDCGNPLSGANGGEAQVSFGNQDASINLQDVGGGVWEGTWTPANPGVQVTVQAVALGQASPFSSIAAGITVTVQPASVNAPAQVSGVVNAASSAQALPGIVTPGGYVAIYGTGLTAGGALPASSIPLPCTMSDTQLLLGNQVLPLVYVSPNQVNALVPQNLNPNSLYQLVVQRGSTRSAPVRLTLAAAQPAIYTLNLSGSGQGIVEIAGTTLLAAPAGNGSRPAQRGTGYLVVFATGLGPVIGADGEAPPADGAGAPLGTIYETVDNVTATAGGVPAVVVFSGLTLSLVNLYQVNILLPPGVPTGDAVPLVLTVTDPSTGKNIQSNTVTVAVQ